MIIPSTTLRYGRTVVGREHLEGEEIVCGRVYAATILRVLGIVAA